MKDRKIKLYKKNKKEIPIFFATDDNYIPFLDVALRSLIDNASKNYNYIINILNTGLKEDNMKAIKLLENDNFKIVFRNISDKIDGIRNKLRNVYHFSVVMYYRIFIESLFPEYDKVLYLDCDIVVLGDVSKLFNTNINNCLLGAVKEQVVNGRKEFRDYAKVAVGVDPQNYFNSGILVMNLKKFREQKIEDQFVYLVNKYNCDVIDPDQAYLNFLCRDQVRYLPNGWNKEPLLDQLEGDLNIVHYALYQKPWQYDDVIDGEYFWKYANKSPFCNLILQKKNAFGPKEHEEKVAATIDIVAHAGRIAASDYTFSKKL
jgi:lipopolysaccharide biosynthesis glycosyltransferase